MGTTTTTTAATPNRSTSPGVDTLQVNLERLQNGYLVSAGNKRWVAADATAIAALINAWAAVHDASVVG